LRDVFRPAKLRVSQLTTVACCAQLLRVADAEYRQTDGVTYIHRTQKLIEMASTIFGVFYTYLYGIVYPCLYLTYVAYIIALLLNRHVKPFDSSFYGLFIHLGLIDEIKDQRSLGFIDLCYFAFDSVNYRLRQLYSIDLIPCLIPAEFVAFSALKNRFYSKAPTRCTYAAQCRKPSSKCN